MLRLSYLAAYIRWWRDFRCTSPVSIVRHAVGHDYYFNCAL